MLDSATPLLPNIVALCSTSSTVSVILGQLHLRALVVITVLTHSHASVQSDIDLPMIAVIGNQSAGKSSLIESISGVTLPRSSGTCTRWYAISLFRATTNNVLAVVGVLPNVDSPIQRLHGHVL